MFALLSSFIKSAGISQVTKEKVHSDVILLLICDSVPVCVSETVTEHEMGFDDCGMCDPRRL